MLLGLFWIPEELVWLNVVLTTTKYDIFAFEFKLLASVLSIEARSSIVVVHRFNVLQSALSTVGNRALCLGVSLA